MRERRRGQRGLENDDDHQESDTTAPRVTRTVPVANATGVVPAANVTATFSEDINASIINGTTFQLFKKGSTKKLAAAVSYSASTDTATLDPTSSLQGGATYKAVVSTVARDLAGNFLDQNSASTSLQEMAWSFTVRK
ncbi:MAG TPA: Ig-like domain-containing protein [Rubrobacter sp.]